MAVCKEVVPPEVIFPDGVRVACHLHPAGQAGGELISAEQVAARRSTTTAAATTVAPTPAAATA